MNDILTAWKWNGSVSEPVPYGEGHINQTYAITVTSEQGAKALVIGAMMLKIIAALMTRENFLFMVESPIRLMYFERHQFR